MKIGVCFNKKRLCVSGVCGGRKNRHCAACGRYSAAVLRKCHLTGRHKCDGQTDDTTRAAQPRWRRISKCRPIEGQLFERLDSRWEQQSTGLLFPAQLVKKVPHGTFLPALSAEHFELVQNAIFQKPCYSKVFGGGLFYLRRALPPQTPPLLTYRNVQHSFSTDCAGSNSPPDCCSQLQRPDGRVKLELVSSHSILFAPKNKTTHRVVLFFGAGDEARTRYLDLGKVALYQMSYARKMVPQAGVEPATRGFSVRCSTN